MSGLFARASRDIPLLVAVGVVLVLGLLPLKTERGPYTAWVFGIGTSTPSDAILNVLLFVPFGFAAARWHNSTGWSRRHWGAVALEALALSLVVETLQTLFPARFPSLVDVASNITGGIAGITSFRLLHGKQLAALTIVYLGLAFAGSAVLARGASLDTWDSNFPLVIGNEATGDRPWNGRVSNVMLIDRMLSGDDLTASVAASRDGRWPDVPHHVRQSVVALYDMRAANACRDLSGTLEPLVWQDWRPCDARPGAPPLLNDTAWLRTRSPARSAAERIRRSGRFTLVTTIEAADRRQHGPARIVSLSASPNERNLTLGQEGERLVVRVRTKLNGLNGALVELVGPVVTTTGPQTVAVTYSGARLRLYTDSEGPAATLSIGPGLAAVARFSPRPIVRRLAGSVLFDVLFFGLIFAPAGILLMIAAAHGHRRWLLGAVLLAAPTLLDWLLVGEFAPRSEYARILAGTIAGLLPAAVSLAVRAGRAPDSGVVDG